MQTNITELMDIKVGYACNNNCLHCVVKSNHYHAKKIEHEENFSFSEIERIVKSKPANTVRKIVITGGEPSIRNDFPEIINMIFDYHPSVYVEVQTNGRELKRHLSKVIHHENLSFTIALHGADEKIHNRVVGTTTSTKNPYKETLSSIEEIINLCGDSQKIAFKIVLNSINFKSFKSITKFLVEKYNACHISVAYPHLDGFYAINESFQSFKKFCHPMIAKSDVESGADLVRKISFSYAEFSDSLKETMDYINTKPQVSMSLEAVPLCAFNNGGEHYEKPKNIRLDINDARIAEVHYTNGNLFNFYSFWLKMHKYPDEICSTCKKHQHCSGLWEETYAVFGTEGLLPFK